MRRENHHKQVEKLFYEAYIPLAEKTGKLILEEAKNKYSIIDACAVHRLGYLAVQDIAVKVLVRAKHRKAAYEANEYIINNIKSRVPIWKKEFYQDGTNSWVLCNHQHSVDYSKKYLRQTNLPSFALNGQEKLFNSKVLD